MSVPWCIGKGSIIISFFIGITVVRLISLENNIEKTLEEISFVKNKRHSIQKEVAMLRPNALDKDFLEERVRLVLGYRNPDEQVIVAN